MTNPNYRKALIAAGIAATLGIGAAGCDSTTDRTSNQPGANQAGSSQTGSNQSGSSRAGASQNVSDTAITAGVKSKLALNRDLESSDISVETNNGTVTLTGSVPNNDTRSEVERATRAFTGVNDVNNRLNVADGSRSSGEASRTSADSGRDSGDGASQAMSDTWITTKVKSVLLADSDAKGLDVKVNTENGVVTLQGELTNQAAIDHVKALAMDVEGVRRVNANALTVASR